MADVRYGTPTDAGSWPPRRRVFRRDARRTRRQRRLAQLGADLDMGFSGLQWVSNGYLVTLRSLILLGGALVDLYGRRKIFVIGTAFFAVASLCVGSPPTAIARRSESAPGVGGAMLTHASLAIIQSSFHPDDRGRAIGAWSGLGGIAAAIGPFLGGGSSRGSGGAHIFLLNLPVAALVIVLAQRHVPESSAPARAGWHPDIAGGALGAIGLAGLTYALIEYRSRGWDSSVIRGAVALTIVGFVGFVVVEMRERHPMLPLGIFASRRFTGSNLATFAIYGALGGCFSCSPYTCKAGWVLAARRGSRGPSHHAHHARTLGSRRRMATKTGPAS